MKVLSILGRTITEINNFLFLSRVGTELRKEGDHLKVGSHLVDLCPQVSPPVTSVRSHVHGMRMSHCHTLSISENQALTGEAHGNTESCCAHYGHEALMSHPGNGGHAHSEQRRCHRGLLLASEPKLLPPGISHMLET